MACDYTPGWFDGILVDEMTLTWRPAGVTGVASEGDTQNGDHILTASSMGYGDKLPLTVTYADWPTALDSQYSRENIPEDYNNGSYYEGDRSLGDTIATVIGHYYDCHYLLVVSVITSIGRYVGGFGYPLCVCQWPVVPRGPGGPSPTRSVAPRPSPAHTSSRKGRLRRRSQGGDFGGSGFGGGPLSMCQQLRACAVPAPAARRGRLQSKNLYGAIHLDRIPQKTELIL